MSHSVGECMPVVFKKCAMGYRWCVVVTLCLISAVSLTMNNAAAQAPAASGSRKVISEYEAAQQRLVRSLSAQGKPLLAADENANFLKIKNSYKKLLSEGPDLSAASRKDMMTQGLRYNLHRVTDPTVQASPFQMGQALLDVRRDLNSCGSLILNAQNKQRYREEVMTIAHELLGDLLKNNLDSRFFALSVLLDLEVVSKGTGAGQNRVVFLEKVPATLKSVLSDTSKEQPDAVRAMAAVQIQRFLEKTEALPVEQMRLAKELSAQLMRTETNPAYQRALIEALIRVTQPREVVGKAVPSVFETFIAVISDRNRSIMVRCQAARGIGRVGFDPQINFEPLAWKVTQLAAEAGTLFNQNPGNSEFAFCGGDLYLAFHHLTQEEAKDAKNVKGMLNRDARSTLIRDAYKEVLKVAGPMISNSGNPIPESDLAAVNEWVKKSVPSNLKYDANGSNVPQ